MLQLDQNIQEKAFDLVHSLTPYWKETLREDLLGYYVLGSLSHGGFNRRYSDIDIAVISENGLSEEMIEDAQKFAVQLSPSLGPKLSIFWSNRNFSEGRLKVLDRIDYIDHAKAIFENEWVNPKRPTKKEIYEYLSGEPLENWRQTAAYFILQDKLLPEEHKKYLRAHLYAARFAYSWLTLNFGSNDTAVTFLAENPVKGLKMDLIFRALECRHKADDPDRLFSDRKLLLEQIEACLNLTFLQVSK